MYTIFRCFPDLLIVPYVMDNVVLLNNWFEMAWSCYYRHNLHHTAVYRYHQLRVIYLPNVSTTIHVHLATLNVMPELHSDTFPDASLMNSRGLTSVTKILGPGGIIQVIRLRQ